MWTKNPGAERLSSLQDYLADPSVRERAWQGRRTHPAWTAKPNAGHRALAALEQAGRLGTIVTQNIDGLHQSAGSSDVIEIHGTVWWAVCLSCGVRTPMPAVLERVALGEADPACLQCGGIQKSATISFGQSLEVAVLRAAEQAAASCDLFFAIGTTLQVFPAAGLCDVALAKGARLVIVNAQPTPYDEVADAVLRDPIGDVLPRLADAVIPAP